MKKDFIFLTACAFMMLNIAANAQVFMKTYTPGSGSSASSFYHEIIPASTGNYMACGSIREQSSNGTDMIITMFDGNGNEVWSQTHGDTSQIETSLNLVEVNQVFYVIGWSHNGVDNQIIVMALDASGNMVSGWPKRYEAVQSSFSKYCYEILPVQNGLVISGHATSNGWENVLFSIDLNGNLLWSHRYNGPNQERAGYDFALLDNGNIASIGYIYDNYRDMQLMITDNSGTLISTKRYSVSDELYGYRIINLGSANGILLIGQLGTGAQKQILVAGVDYTGTLQWAKEYGVNGQEDHLGDAILLNDGTIAIVGDTRNPNSLSHRVGLVLQIDKTGAIISQYGYRPGTNSNLDNRFFSVDQKSNGNLILAGLGTSPVNSDIGFIVAGTTLSGLELKCGKLNTALQEATINLTVTNYTLTQTQGFTFGPSQEALQPEVLSLSWSCIDSELASEEWNIPGGITVFPNPFTTGVTVEWETEEFPAGGHIEIFDAYGQMIKSQGIEGNSAQINLQGIAKGMYVYRIYDSYGEIKANGKITSQ